eukprot:SAG11_NODE_13740_length_640_cov_2.352399_1_plen_100_part_00
MVEDEVDELVRAQSREEECEDAAAQARVRVRQVHGEADAKVKAARANGRAAVEKAMGEASARLRVTTYLNSRIPRFCFFLYQNAYGLCKPLLFFMRKVQ